MFYLVNTRYTLIKHQIVLLEMSFHMSSHNNGMFSGNSQPKLLKSAKL